MERVASPPEFVHLMLAVLDFRGIERELVSVPRTVQTFQAYQAYREQGLNKRDAIERVLYG